MSPFEPNMDEMVDDEADEWSAEEVRLLAQLHKLPVWQPLKRALRGSQARAYQTIASPEATIERIREEQGRIANARMVLDLVERVAPARYERERPKEPPTP